MSEPWSAQFDEGVKRWCERMAVFSVDALVDAGVVRREEFRRGVDVVAEELLVHLGMLNYPPVPASLRQRPGD